MADPPPDPSSGSRERSESDHVSDDGAASGSFDDWASARWPALLRFARLVTGEGHDAQDAVQDALVAVYPRWRSLQAAGTTEAYVRRSIVNSTISRWRKHRRHESPADDLTAVAAGDGVEPDLALRLSDADLAWDLCRQLPTTQRAAVVLRFYEDLSFADIATTLACTESTARSHVHRALAALRLILGPEDTDD